MSFNIISNRNSPITGLQQQIGQIGAQVKEHSKYDTHVVNFNNQPVNKDEEMKLYTPVRIESFYDHRTYYITNIIKMLITPIALITIVTFITIVIFYFITFIGI